MTAAVETAAHAPRIRLPGGVSLGYDAPICIFEKDSRGCGNEAVSWQVFIHDLQLIALVGYPSIVSERTRFLTDGLQLVTSWVELLLSSHYCST